jgi:predicted amidohydrolase
VALNAFDSEHRTDRDSPRWKMHVSRPATIRIAAAQYPIEQIEKWDHFRMKLRRWVSEAVDNRAQLLVFPEYGAMELASMFQRRRLGDRCSAARHTLGSLPVTSTERHERPRLEREANVLQSLLPAYRALHAELAEQYGVYILASSIPVRGTDGALRNTAYFFAPNRTMGWQEKIVLTRWERECWGITGGNEVRYFNTGFGPIGIAICYDIEFPLIARAQAEAKARIILAPCCTHSLRGYHRVQVGARARALENQAYIVQSPTIGEAPWSMAVAVNVGSAGFYAPPDLGPKEDGIIILGSLNLPQWIYADLDLAAIDQIRQNGSLANQEDWAGHVGIGSAVAGQFQAVTLDVVVPEVRG